MPLVFTISSKETCTLFGDGAAAVIIGKSDAGDSWRILCSRMETYGKGAHLSECQGGGNQVDPKEYAQNPQSFLFAMDGKGIYRLASQIMPGFVERMLQPSGLSMADMQRQVQEQISASLIELFKRLNCQIPEIRYQDKMSKPPNHKKLRRIQREFQPS